MTLNSLDQLSTVTFNNSLSSLAVKLQDLNEGVDSQNTSRYIGVYYASETRENGGKSYEYFGTKPCVDMVDVPSHEF